MIHNYDYQGEIFEDCVRYLPSGVSSEIELIFNKYKSASMLALGIEKGDFVGTVSHTYATELVNGHLPHKGLKYIRRNRSKIKPFLNGVDYHIWHPNNSPYLERNYSLQSLGNKRETKKDIFNYCDFDIDELGQPLVLMMARLTPQKGIQLVANHTLKPAETEKKCNKNFGNGS